MNTCKVLLLAVFAVSLAQARMTYRQLLQLAKPADEYEETGHDIKIGELDDEIDFLGILKDMGHDINLAESNDVKIPDKLEHTGDLDMKKTINKVNDDLNGNVKAGDCACSGKTCVCCCALTFTYEGKRYYIYYCARITHIRDSLFYVELFFQGTRVCSRYVTKPGGIICGKVGIKIYYVSSTRFCAYLYFVVNGKIYKCTSHCLTLSASSFGMKLAKSKD